MFCGFFPHGSDAFGIIQCENLNRSPAEPAAAPTFKIYSPDGNLLDTGTATVFDASNLSHAYKWTIDTGNGNYERGSVYIVYASYVVATISRTAIYSFIVS